MAENNFKKVMEEAAKKERERLQSFGVEGYIEYLEDQHRTLNCRCLVPKD